MIDGIEIAGGAGRPDPQRPPGASGHPDRIPSPLVGGFRRPVDLAVGIQHLHVEIDGQLAPLIPGFIDNTRQEVAELEAAVASTDREAARRLGHRIKGACLCYGFDDMGAMAAGIETAAAGDEGMEVIGEKCEGLKRRSETVEVRFV